jgi:TatD DNase family protein
MKFTDTHCHLYLPEFEPDAAAMMQRALEKGVEKFYLPAIDSQSMEALLAFEKSYPGSCFTMMGLHPCSVNDGYLQELKRVEEQLIQRRFAAIGEIGLDFYWDRSFEKQQYLALRQQIEWAKQYGLPIVIHSRDSLEQCIALVKEYQDGNLNGIFHCFSGNADLAKQIVDLGFYLGIGGVLTYKKSGLPEALTNIDLKYMVLETDAPYLTPVPFRGKRNESSYIVYTAQKLAEIKAVSMEEVASVTSANAERIFGS